MKDIIIDIENNSYKFQLKAISTPYANRRGSSYFVSFYSSNKTYFEIRMYDESQVKKLAKMIKSMLELSPYRYTTDSTGEWICDSLKCCGIVEY